MAVTSAPPPPTADALARAEQALASFAQVVQRAPGFKQRAGQRAMAERVALTLAQADLGQQAAPQRAIAVIQAGTGVGKSAAYLCTAISLALQRQTRVLVSTATVALQEQLIHKDLPALAAAMDRPFAYALAKGRGRYVCQVKLARLAGDASAEDDLFDDAFPAAALGTASQQALQERRLQLYGLMQTRLASGEWDGDRDTLAQAPDGADWAPVAAERHSCTARHCPQYKACSYYQARSRLAESQVIVANHDLVLSTLGLKMLPELDNCLVIFDEGHHLPAVALDQFASSMNLSNVRWLDQLPRVMQEVAKKLSLQLAEDVSTVSSQLKAVLTQTQKLVLDLLQAHSDTPDATLRFPQGILPEALQEPMGQIGTQASGLLRALDALGTEVKTLAKEDPSMATLCAQHYARLGAMAPRLSSLADTALRLQEHPEQPLAKWLQAQTDENFLTLSAHACEMVPGGLLRQHLWSQVRAAVVTSASLTSCGSFGYFLQEAGLSGNSAASTLEVESPFDYARQGTLSIVHTRAEPRQADAYTAEMVELLLQDLEQVAHGALALFTSRAQMRAATLALPPRLIDRVLVQGTLARTRLLDSHRARVEAGLPSILFGLQSFGEGLDLPGVLCETVFICKLPFAPPSAPVDEARAEWLRSQGRDPFSELVVPATAIKLLQWTGRAIRTEEDRAQVICYDKRLQLQPYGRRMLQGLPGYAVVQRQQRT